MARIGMIRCFCCGAAEDMTRLFLAHQCQCHPEQCMRCSRCFEHCECGQGPLGFLVWVKAEKETR